MSRETHELETMDMLNEAFQRSIQKRDKRTAFAAFKRLEAMGISAPVKESMEDSLMRCRSNKAPLLGRGEGEDYTQEEMNGSFIGINKGNDA